MTDIADQLRNAYETAGNGNRVVAIHLFAIEHAGRLKGMNLKDLAARAGISENYGPELNKGVKLADYVEIVRKL